MQIVEFILLHSIPHQSTSVGYHPIESAIDLDTNRSLSLSFVLLLTDPRFLGF